MLTLPALIVSLLLLWLCLHLKERELYQRHSQLPRIVLIIPAALMGIVAWTLLWVGIFGDRIRKPPEGLSRWQRTGRVLASGGFCLIVMLPLMAATGWIASRMDQMELRALARTGILSRQRISTEHYLRPRKSRGGYYQYDFQVVSPSGLSYSLSVQRRSPTLSAGDSIDIIYLPVNPAIFKEVVYRDGKAAMVRFR